MKIWSAWHNADRSSRKLTFREGMTPHDDDDDEDEVVYVMKHL